MTKQPIPIYCHKCSTRIAEIVGGRLVIRNKHNGQTHESALTPAELRRILEQMEQSDEREVA